MVRSKKAEKHTAKESNGFHNHSTLITMLKRYKQKNEVWKTVTEANKFSKTILQSLFDLLQVCLSPCLVLYLQGYLYVL